MSEHAEQHHHTNYVKIWGILLVLLVISITGPIFGIMTVTLLTAFGIAIVKALMVCAYFMHLNVEKKFIWYLLLVSLTLLGLFFFAVAPDVMAHSGDNWVTTRPPHVPAVAHHHEAHSTSEHH